MRNILISGNNTSIIIKSADKDWHVFELLMSGAVFDGEERRGWAQMRTTVLGTNCFPECVWNSDDERRSCS